MNSHKKSKGAKNIRNMLIRSLVISFFIGAFAIVSNAQSNSKIIKFPAGKNAVTEKFNLSADDGINYLMQNLKQFNLVKFTVTGSYTNGADAQGLTIQLTKLGQDDEVLAEAAPGEEIEYQIQKGDGDYQITVMNPGTRRANITLNLTLNGESADSDVCEGCENPNDAEAERIKLAKGKSDVDLDIQLEGKTTKKYVAFVAKGYMTCIMPETSLGSGVTIKVNGKVHNPDNGPCTKHSTVAGDQFIEFINNGNKEKNFSVSVGFHQKN